MRKTRSDKGTVRELTELGLRAELITEGCRRLTAAAKQLARDIKKYDQRDRLKQDKTSR